jgi:hypothetical protein
LFMLLPGARERAHQPCGRLLVSKT